MKWTVKRVILLVVACGAVVLGGLSHLHQNQLTPPEPVRPRTTHLTGQPVLDNLGAIQERINEVRQQVRDTQSELASFPRFQLQGKITDRDVDMISLFGRAIPLTASIGTLGSLLDESNILVLNPTNVRNPVYHAEPEAYFVKKTYGPNAFGVAVPVYVYTTNRPPAAGDAMAKIRALEIERDQLQARYDALYAKEKEERFDKARNDPAELLRCARDWEQKQEYPDAIRAYRRAVELTPDDSSVRLALVALLIQQSSGEEASDHLKRILAREPRNVEAARRLAHVAVLLGDKLAAVPPLRAFLNVAPPGDQDMSWAEAQLDSIVGSDESWRRKGSDFLRQIAKLEDEIFHSETSWGRSRLQGDIAERKGRLERLRQEYQQALDEARSLGVDTSLLVVKDDAYWQERAEAARALRRDIDLLRHLAWTDQKSGNAKGAAENQSMIVMVQDRLAQIEADLATRGSTSDGGIRVVPGTPAVSRQGGSETEAGSQPMTGQTLGLPNVVPGSARRTTGSECPNNTLELDPETQFYTQLVASGMLYSKVVNQCWKGVPRNTTGKVVSISQDPRTHLFRVVVQWNIPGGRMDSFSKNNFDRLVRITE